MSIRVETDSLGNREIPAEAYYGIHSLRARENFPARQPFPRAWYRALALVKQACYTTCERFYRALDERFPGEEDKLRRRVPRPAPEVLAALIRAAAECRDGARYDQFIVPAVSGGAGTSVNMNMNEIIANAALESLGRPLGDYAAVDPIEDANIYQSTNDVVPTALTLAVMDGLDGLEAGINRLRAAGEQLEKNSRDISRTGYTQMQAAVPTTYGRLFSAYNDAWSRDWWRVSKCVERIKTVNLGGGAAGTGLTVPRYIVMETVPVLRRLSSRPLTRAENLSDATSNLDRFVEVHGILKTAAVTLEKAAADLRLLASDLSRERVSLPPRQAGSSIMPGKINPVIPEYIISCAHRVYANDGLVTSLAAQGCLELNAYLPVMGTALLESLDLLTAAYDSAGRFMLRGVRIDSDASRQVLLACPVVVTALIPEVGYHRAGELGDLMRRRGWDIYQANRELGLLPEPTLERLLAPEALLQLGFRPSDYLGREET